MISRSKKVQRSFQNTKQNKLINATKGKILEGWSSSSSPEGRGLSSSKKKFSKGVFTPIVG